MTMQGRKPFDAYVIEAHDDRGRIVELDRRGSQPAALALFKEITERPDEPYPLVRLVFVMAEAERTEDDGPDAVLVGDTYVPPAEAAGYAGDEAEALGNPERCLNCGKETVACADADCWHRRGNAEPRIHGDSLSHYCHPDRPGSMVAEVNRNG